MVRSVELMVAHGMQFISCYYHCYGFSTVRVPLVEASRYTGPHIHLVDVVRGEEILERAANMLQGDLAAVQEAIDKVLYCGLLAAE